MDNSVKGKVFSFLFAGALICNIIGLFMFKSIENLDLTSLFISIVNLVIYSLIDKKSIGRKKNVIVMSLLSIVIFLSYKFNIYLLLVNIVVLYDLFNKYNSKKLTRLVLMILLESLVLIGLYDIFSFDFIEKITKIQVNINQTTSMIINCLILLDFIYIFVGAIKAIKYEKMITYLMENINLFTIFSSLIIVYTNISNIFIMIIPLIIVNLKMINIFKYKDYINIYKEPSKKIKSDNIKKVSVVIPNYNYEKYIIERIDSILRQTYPIYELIILDDKSTDNSVNVIKEKIEKIKIEHPNLIVKFIQNKKNSGNVFKQWRRAFKESTGDFLWIAEADDSCSTNFLENIMIPFNENDDVIISYTESLTMDENNKILMNNLIEWIDIFKTGKWNSSFIDTGSDFCENFLCINNTIANVSSLVFKKKKNIDFDKYLVDATKYRLAGDWYFYEKVLLHGSIAYNKNSFNYHRMQSNSVTLTTKREKEYEEICSIQSDIIKNYHLTKEMKERLEERKAMFRHNFGFCEDEMYLEKQDFEKIKKKNKINDEILLSIIIPVYNTEKYLEKCLNSVIKSIPTNTEIIIVNDGSTDNSNIIIEEFKKEYPEIIKYFKKPNGGLSHTKNYGISKSKGRYIGFVDSDDYVKDDMFDVMLKKALIEDADIVYCDVEMVYEDGSYRYVCSSDESIKDSFMKNINTPLMPASWSKIVKRKLFDGLTYPEGYNNEDIAVSPILFGRSNKTCKIETPFYKYLQRTGSIQNSEFNQKRFVAFYTSKLCFERAKEFSKSKQEKIKGTVYTHQLLALLIYPIMDVKDKNTRKSLMQEFCKNMNEFNDYENNKFVIKYINDLNLNGLLELIRERKINKIEKLIRKNVQ